MLHEARFKLIENENKGMDVVDGYWQLVLKAIRIKESIQDDYGHIISQGYKHRYYVNIILGFIFGIIASLVASYIYEHLTK